jgi:hypothetical protein
MSGTGELSDGTFAPLTRNDRSFGRRARWPVRFGSLAETA